MAILQFLLQSCNCNSQGYSFLSDVRVSFTNQLAMVMLMMKNDSQFVSSLSVIYPSSQSLLIMDTTNQTKSIQIKINKKLVVGQRRKPECIGENLSQESKELTNSTHAQCRVLNRASATLMDGKGPNHCANTACKLLQNYQRLNPLISCLLVLKTKKFSRSTNKVLCRQCVQYDYQYW